MTEYPQHSVHAMPTFEKACQYALNRGLQCRIMECPASAGSTYGTGWHVIVSGFDHYEAQGYITRATVKLVIERTP